MHKARFVVSAEDPRAPSQALWDELSAEERARIVSSLPSEVPLVSPPEGDGHRLPKERAHSALEEYYRRIGRSVYLGAELPVYYPDESMFAPDVFAVFDVDPHERQSWVVSHEGRGLDFVLEIHAHGNAQKDFELNVVRYARLGIPEYFAFDSTRGRLLGWRLAPANDRKYEPIVPQEGRWASRVLGLDLALEEGGLRFYHGSAPLLHARELIGRLSSMVGDAVRRAEEEARRAEETSKRAEEEARRAEETSKRAEEEARRAEETSRRVERLAARLRELGIDPDSVE